MAKAFPDIIGQLKIDGDFNVCSNEIEAFPQGFSRISVTGSIFVSHNDLKRLPENIGALCRTQFGLR